MYFPLKVTEMSLYITSCCYFENYFVLRRVNKFQERQTVVNINYFSFMRCFTYSVYLHTTHFNTKHSACEISRFHREVAENYNFLDCYPACSGNPLRTFREKISVIFTLQDGTDRLSRNVDKELPQHAA